MVLFVTQTSLRTNKILNSLYLLAIITFFNQGIGNLAAQPLYYFLRETLGISVPTIMTLGALANLPWMIKPLWGFLSDSFTIFGYRRKSYIILFAFICTIASLLIGLSPFISLPVLIGLMIFGSIGEAGGNVAVNGMVVEEGNQTGETGKLQSIEWGSLGVGSVITGVLGGYIAEKASYHFAYIILALFPILIAITALKHHEPKAENQNKAVKPIIQDFLLKLKNKQIFLVCAFLFLLWFSPSFGTPLLDRMRTVLHMSKVWIGWLDTIGAACGILGAVVYFKINQKINMKRWLYYGTLISAIATFAYLWLTPTTLLWYTIVFGVSTQFIHLQMLNLMALTCPKGTEATTYALLCSLVNAASFFSNLVGAKCFALFGYNGLIIISGVTTLMCLGFIPFLEVRND
jgi:MFS family permease